MPECKHCKHRGHKFNNTHTEITFECKVSKKDLSDTNDDFVVDECDSYKSKYIEYPLTVSAIESPEGHAIVPGLYSSKVGSLVGVRPCGEKYGNKTYLGIFLGEADNGLMISHHPETHILSINRMYNPAMFVPELKEVIYGSGSWWSIIDSEDKLNEITDETIANQWYVKFFKEITNKKEIKKDGKENAETNTDDNAEHDSTRVN